MTEREQAIAFESDLRALIHRYRCEFNLTYPVVIGLLCLAQYDLYCETIDDANEDEKT